MYTTAIYSEDSSETDLGNGSKRFKMESVIGWAIKSALLEYGLSDSEVEKAIQNPVPVVQRVGDIPHYDFIGNGPMSRTDASNRFPIAFEITYDNSHLEVEGIETEPISGWDHYNCCIDITLDMSEKADVGEVVSTFIALVKRHAS